MDYSEYLAENLDSINYSEYIAEKIDSSIQYCEYLAENLDDDYFEEEQKRLKQELRIKKLNRIMEDG